MAAQVGKRERLLVEQRSKRSADELMGRTDAFRAVIVPAAPGVGPGALVDATIVRATHTTLFGAIADAAPWSARPWPICRTTRSRCCR